MYIFYAFHLLIPSTTSHSLCWLINAQKGSLWSAPQIFVGLIFLACPDQVSIFSGVACGLQTVCSTRGDVVRVAEGRKLTRGDLV